jgi:hypothetical protein
VIDTKLRVWPTTTDPNAILVRRDDLFIVNGDRGAAVIESLTILNQTNLAYIGRGGGDSRSAPTFGIALPPAAENIRVENASIDIPRLVRTDFGMGLTIAVPPNETQITYSYTIEGTAGRYTLSRTALYPTVEMSVYSEPSFDVSSNRLDKSGTVSIKGKDYARFSAPDGVDAGDEVQIVATANADIPWWTFAAGGAGVLVVVALAFLFARRRARRRIGRAAGEPAPIVPSSEREALIASIATLDLEHDSGRIADDEWETRRAELKAQLEALPRE